MTDTTAPARTGRVEFTGGRQEMLGIILRGYALMLPTIGLYRFWQATWKRRFYWQNTVIDGEPIEYTGTASQLLLGFFFALAFFLPIYVAFFVLSMQDIDFVLLGYAGIAAVVWFLMGYAVYRARDFRLSRTLWRGIRFDQAGNAWAYALRRFFWSLLVGVTAGLAYPFMAASLWRYRYSHTWFGDRQFGFSGSWKALARPYYLGWGAVAVISTVGLGMGAGMGGLPAEGEAVDPAGTVPMILAAALVGLVVTWYRARELSAMFSAVTLGEAKLAINVRARSLVGQYLLFAAALAATYIVLTIGGVIVLGAVAGDAFVNGDFDINVLMSRMQSSGLVLAAIVFGYLLILGAFALMSELFLGLGFWKLVASGARITGIESLRSVRARGEDTSLAGEGLADALNVGAY